MVFQTAPVAFTWGQPLPVTVTLSATASLSAGCTELIFDPIANTWVCAEGSLLPSWNGGESVDFSNNATITGVSVFDSDGNPVSTFTISSNSGAQWGPDGITPLSPPISDIPEPDTYQLLLVGILSFVVIRFVSKSDTPRRAGGLMSWTASKAVD
jgi:hypothetical protein